MILDKIVDAKRDELIKQKDLVPESVLDKQIESMNPLSHRFIDNVRRNDGEHLKVIAEIKKASPSKGLIRANFDPESIAQTYADLGVDAISVLTEKNFFQGSLDYLSNLSGKISVPMLRKDFIFDEYQIKEAVANGASAVLLIAAILDVKLLRKYISVCDQFGLDYIVEIHDQEDLAANALLFSPLLRDRYISGFFRKS